MAGKSHYKDTDYLHATARVRVMENTMVTAKDFQRMIDAKSAEEAYKVLADAAICHGRPLSEYEEALNRNLLTAYKLVEDIAPDTTVVEIFRYKYDGHNLKTLVKGKKASGDVEELLSPLGNVAISVAKSELESGKFDKISPILGEAALESMETLARTGDPQQVDLCIDRATLETMAQRTEEFNNPFLSRFVAAQIDIANIRTAVRMLRMGKDARALRCILADGGLVKSAALTEAYTRGMEELQIFIVRSPYGRQLESAVEDLRSGGSLTLFEKFCDNYITSLLDVVKTIPFGVEPLVAYLYAKELETQAARIVLASKLAGVPAGQIAERLRETYA